jgi:hypothetical protein
MDGGHRRVVTPPRIAIAEETLAQETNDRRVLASRLARLVVEIGVGLRTRCVEADALALSVLYADGREGRARHALAPAAAAEHLLGAAALALLDRAITRRVRVRRLRLEARESALTAMQLSLWDGMGDEAGGRRPRAALESALDRVRSRFGTEALVPAAWMAHGLVVRPPARP